MASLVQCAGFDVMRAEIHMPLRGIWWANLRLDTSTIPTLKSMVTISATNGISISGTVVKAGVFLDSVYAHVVGGAGGIGVLAGPFAYQNAVLADPLNAILGASRETLSPTVTIGRVQLPVWTSTQKHAARLLDELCTVATASLGQSVNWRCLPDGTIWIGAETWPTSSLPIGSDVVMQHPVNPWFEIGCETPTLLPGVNLSDIGGFNVSGVDHWIDAEKIRSWVWTIT